MPINRLVWFVAKARIALAQSIEDDKVGVHPETLFLGTVLHSLDHTLLYQNTSWTKLLISKKFNIDATLFAMLFINPTRGLYINTRMSTRQEPWLKNLYDKLTKIEPVYASLVHYCISW